MHMDIIIAPFETERQEHPSFMIWYYNYSYYD